LFALEKAIKYSNNLVDITKVTGKELPDHNMITYSFPCQDLSLQGVRKGLHEGTSSSML